MLSPRAGIKPNDSEDFEMHIEDPNILPDQELHEKLSLEQLEKALMSLPEDWREGGR